MAPYRTQSRDTRPEVERFLIARLRTLSTAEKFAMIRRACRAAEQWTLAGLRHRHPDVGEEELRLLAAEQRLGSTLFGKALRRDGKRKR